MEAAALAVISAGLGYLGARLHERYRTSTRVRGAARLLRDDVLALLVAVASARKQQRWPTPVQEAGYPLSLENWRRFDLDLAAFLPEQDLEAIKSAFDWVALLQQADTPYISAFFDRAFRDAESALNVLDRLARPRAAWLRAALTRARVPIVGR